LTSTITAAVSTFVSVCPLAAAAVPEAKITRLNEKIATLRQEIQRLNALNSEIM